MKRSVEGPILDCILADEQPRSDFFTVFYDVLIVRSCFPTKVHP